MNKVVTKSDVKKAIKLKGFFGNIAASFLMWILGLNKLNKKYSKISQFEGRDFTTAVMREFGFGYELDDRQLKNIPQEGPFILVSNFPYGSIEGIILLHIVSAVRPEIKFLGNFMLSIIANLRDYIFPINPFVDHPEFHNSFSGLRQASETLVNGGCLGLFPAGEVSTFYGGIFIQDKEWQISIIKLIKNAGVPVIPVYCHGTNSRFFHWAGRIHPLLRTLRLPKELLNKRGKIVSVRIGKSISPSEISEYKDLKSLGAYLKARTYALEANIITAPKVEARALTPIALPNNRKHLQKEINALPQNCFLFSTGNYVCYLADYKLIPMMMHELGRRREESFRAVGEGTGKPLDLDEYDEYYKHLILWDKHRQSLVGAYRLGFGKNIIEQRGIKGLYSNSLFGYEKPFQDVLKQSIELGRSFVTLDYQKDALPLMLLIKGLLYSVLSHPEVKYLIGPVSISSWYPKFYRSVMIYYIQNKYSIKNFDDYVVPRNPFFPDYLRVKIDDLMKNKMESIEQFDRFLLRLSNNEYRLPTLVKKYLKINSKIIKFNVDPDFNYCVDGLVLLDLTQISKQEIINLSKDEPDKDKVYKRFGIEKN